MDAVLLDLYDTVARTHWGRLSERFTAENYPKLTNIALTPDERGLYAVSSTADERIGALFYIELKP